MNFKSHISGETHSSDKLESAIRATSGDGDGAALVHRDCPCIALDVVQIFQGPLVLF